MQVSVVSAFTPQAQGSSLDIRQLLNVANVFADEGNQSFETKRAAWFEYQRIVREGKYTGEWSAKMSKEQADAISAAVEGSDFARSIAMAERTYANRLLTTGSGRNPHEDAVRAADSMSNKQLAFLEISLIDKEGVTLSEWRDREGAMANILDVWRMAEAEEKLKPNPDLEMLKALKKLYESVGSGKTKPADFEWPDGTEKYVKLLAKRNASREPEDVVELSPDALALLRRQSQQAWRDGSAARALG